VLLEFFLTPRHYNNIRRPGPAEYHTGSTATKPGEAAQDSAEQDRQILQIGHHTHTHIFYPFAIETAGTWHEMAIELTQEIGRHITTITEDIWETTFLSNAFPWLYREEMRFLSTTPW